MNPHKYDPFVSNIKLQQSKILPKHIVHTTQCLAYGIYTKQSIVYTVCKIIYNYVKKKPARWLSG